jgi:hypothetical protein
VYKATADARQFQRRDGNHSTKGTSRGVNLLGWEQPEHLSPEQQRRAMAARVSQINEFLRANKDVPKWRREALGAEQKGLEERMRAIRPTRRAPDVRQHFIDVARERLTLAEFNIWMGEAVERDRRAAQVRVIAASSEAA